MNADLILTIGLVVSAFAVPAVVSDLSDRRAPRFSALTIMIGGGLVVYAASVKPGGYTLADIPEAFYSGIAHTLP
ncbi:MAG: hypothetical protein KDK29_11940 [Sedimentitalea sp.]|nr:hypothetical protein [Sedimentitalea sp.]